MMTTDNNGIILTNDIREVERLAAFVDRVCEAGGVDAATAFGVNLALEEAVVNVISYAYPVDTQGDIAVEAAVSNKKLTFVVRDEGVPFDPTAVDEADTTSPADERDIGGLGIHLIRHYMDTVRYRRHNGQNILTLTKQLNQ